MYTFRSFKQYSFPLSQVSSVGRASDFRPQDCGLKSHCEQEFLILHFLLLMHSLQVDWDHTNEIKHDIHPRYIGA